MERNLNKIVQLCGPSGSEASLNTPFPSYTLEVISILLAKVVSVGFMPLATKKGTANIISVKCIVIKMSTREHFSSLL